MLFIINILFSDNYGNMAVLHRALFTWFVLLVFFILLVLQLEEKINWSWFAVFFPLWFYDVILILCIVFNMLSQCQSGLDRCSNSIQKKICYIIAVLCKITAQTLCCLRLNQIIEISMFYIFMPIWVIMPVILTDVFRNLIKPSGNRYI